MSRAGLLNVPEEQRQPQLCRRSVESVSAVREVCLLRIEHVAVAVASLALAPRGWSGQRRTCS